MPTAKETSTFLSQVKMFLNANNYEILDRRYKYMSTLSQLGIIEQDVIDDIKSLTVRENWEKEPDKDPSFPGDVWKCKKNLRGQCIYIKLKIKQVGGGRLLIMSYHIDGM